MGYNVILVGAAGGSKNCSGFEVPRRDGRRHPG